jgi:hypothetical protein
MLIIITAFKFGVNQNNRHAGRALGEKIQARYRSALFSKSWFPDIIKVNALHGVNA